MQKQIRELEVLRKVFEKIPVSPELTKKLMRKSLINSAVSSARIEDIPSTVEHPRLEGRNLLQAYQNFSSSSYLGPFTIELVKSFHSQAMKGLSDWSGQFRSESWAVFNQSGTVIHLAPLPSLVPDLMKKYVEFIKGQKNDHPCVAASTAQFIFEKIHPFADGNGRTGRLITAFLLYRFGFSFGGMVSLEKYIEDHRGEYYAALEPSHNCSKFIRLVLGGLVEKADQTLEEINNPPIESAESLLLPRRRELLETIRDHPECSFDFLSRRYFRSVATLHRGLTFLQRKNLIRKLGDTRGAVYIANSVIL